MCKCSPTSERVNHQETRTQTSVFFNFPNPIDWQYPYRTRFPPKTHQFGSPGFGSREPTDRNNQNPKSRHGKAGHLHKPIFPSTLATDYQLSHPTFVGCHQLCKCQSTGRTGTGRSAKNPKTAKVENYPLVENDLDSPKSMSPANQAVPNGKKREDCNRLACSKSTSGSIRIKKSRFNSTSTGNR